MDIGKVLRERVKFRTYRSDPKSPSCKKWGVYPVVKVDKDMFFEDDEFKCEVSLFSYDSEEILRMQSETIAEAAKGIVKNGWIFYLHAANHRVLKMGRLHRSEIRLIFKVKNAQKIQEEVK